MSYQILYKTLAALLVMQVAIGPGEGESSRDQESLSLSASGQVAQYETRTFRIDKEQAAQRVLAEYPITGSMDGFDPENWKTMALESYGISSDDLDVLCAAARITCITISLGVSFEVDQSLWTSRLIGAIRRRIPESVRNWFPVFPSRQLPQLQEQIVTSAVFALLDNISRSYPNAQFCLRYSCQDREEIKIDTSPRDPEAPFIIILGRYTPDTKRAYGPHLAAHKRIVEALIETMGGGKFAIHSMALAEVPTSDLTKTSIVRA